METIQRSCPMCEQLLTEEDSTFVCSEHGSWHAYGTMLLVLAPAEAAKQPERVAMPWESLVPAAL